MALRAKTVSVEAEDEDFGDSKARTTTKDETIFAATRRDEANFPDSCVRRRSQTPCIHPTDQECVHGDPSMRRFFFLLLGKIGSRLRYPSRVNRA